MYALVQLHLINNTLLQLLSVKYTKGSLQKKKNYEDRNIVPIRWEGGQSKWYPDKIQIWQNANGQNAKPTYCKYNKMQIRQNANETKCKPDKMQIRQNANET